MEALVSLIMLSQVEKTEILRAVISDYLFRFAFESRNPGCYFDLDSWMQDLDNFSPEDFSVVNSKKWQEILHLVTDIDKYAKKISKN